MGQSGTVLFRRYDVIKLLSYRVIYVTHCTRGCGILPILQRFQPFKEPISL